MRKRKKRFDLLEYLKWELEQEQKDSALIDAKIRLAQMSSEWWIKHTPRGKFPSNAGEVR